MEGAEKKTPAQRPMKIRVIDLGFRFQVFNYPESGIEYPRVGGKADEHEHEQEQE